ncbi:hypothetical protein IHQ72_33445 [Mesorhizobium onobrychidis]|uniref:DUF924 family protein n=1 Tax=Mesorhizobium onobrychidis TaxID=2775404 RepID=A0ABY5R9G4_9HYPH|nr:hypothetical protein [Mesorhizobium onobrychidis]UVC19277.1 hypothetical protein IHQ72_33445 [Mesorhizobium onobrychidis]
MKSAIHFWFGADASKARSRRLFDAVATEELVLKRIVGQLARQGPAQSNRGCTLQIILHRTARYPQYDRNLAGARPASGKPQHFVSIVSWSAFSLPASKCPRSSRGD